MHLIALLVGTAIAAPVYWTSAPDPASIAAIEAAVPGAEARPFAALLPQVDDAYGAIDHLAAEYAAVLPLVDVFDGELQIMARLSKASVDVRALRSPADRDLLARTLQLTGFAVARTYQDDLATDPAAAPYRRTVGATTAPAAWFDAAALAAVPTPSAEAVPEQAQRLTYDAARVAVESMPRGALVLGALADGAEVRVDGAPVSGTTRVTVVPGRHFVSVTVGGAVLAAVDVRVESGADVRVDAPYGPAEHERLLSAILSGGTDAWPMPEAPYVLARIGEPRTYVAVPAGARSRLYAIDGTSAARIPLTGGSKRPASTDAGWSVDGVVAAGGAWAYAPDWYTVHAPEGAPYDVSTVNAGAPVVSSGVRVRKGLVAASAGLDGALAVGAYHDWPTGTTRTRAFLYPHLGAGLPWLQVTAGPLFPFWFGVGARASVPIAGRWELHAGGVRGLGIDATRADGSRWEPYDTTLVWGGVGLRLGP